MKVQDLGPFETYFSACSEVEKRTFQENGDGVKGLRTVHDYISTLLADAALTGRASPIFLSFHAFILLLAGMRQAASGHAASIFPLLRTALESACYAYLITKDPELETVWSNRNKDESSLKACRRAFRTAVADTSRSLDELQTGSGHYISDAYESAIDHGAHPNSRAIFGHLRTQETDRFFEAALVGVYGHDDFESRRAILACWDFGLAIAIVVTRSHSDLTEDLASKLQAMNDAKELYASSLGST